VLQDEGAGVPKTTVELGSGEDRPGAVLVVFSAESGRMTSVIPVWEAALTSQAGSVSGVRVEGVEGRIVIRGAMMEVYDGAGRLVTGGRRVGEVVLDKRGGIISAG
jgi:hypothetical protein